MKQAYISPKAEGNAVQNLFSRIAGVYDLLNHILSFGLDVLWRKRLIDAVLPFPPHGTAKILDLAAGTLEVSVGLAKKHPHRTILAVDFCLPMLQKGREKLSKKRCENVHVLAGDGKRLPLPDNSVDAVTIAFGLRNIRPREDAYAEALRVLTPGGRLCVLEFGSAHDRILFGFYNIYLTHILPLVGKIVSRDKGAYRYLAETIAEYPSAARLADEMRLAGFVDIRYRRYTGGIVWLHTGTKKI